MNIHAMKRFLVATLILFMLACNSNSSSIEKQNEIIDSLSMQVTNQENEINRLRASYEEAMKKDSARAAWEQIVQVKSPLKHALYFNCGNPAEIQLPSLGNDLDLNYMMQGGLVTKGSEPGKITLMPSDHSNVTLAVMHEGKELGTLEFSVIPVPLPEIIVGTDRGIVSLGEGIPAKTPRIFLKAQPDESFAALLPEDAKYQVSQCEISLIRNGSVLRTNQAGNRIDLRTIAPQARKGDHLRIKIKKVQRQKFNKEIVEVPIGPTGSFITVPLK
jgi:hypothetical protein